MTPEGLGSHCQPAEWTIQQPFRTDRASVLNATVIRTFSAVTSSTEKLFEWIRWTCDFICALRSGRHTAHGDTHLGWHKKGIFSWQSERLGNLPPRPKHYLPRAAAAGRKEERGCTLEITRVQDFTHTKPWNPCSDAEVGTITRLFIFLVITAAILDLQLRRCS